MGSEGGSDRLVLLNANVITVDASLPRGNMIVVSDGRIAWVGEQSQASPSTFAAADVIDCGGRTVVPGFIDAHCHVLAYAARLSAVDCSPSAVSTIDDILHELRLRAEVTPRGEWIRASGYSEFDLREKRHPTCLELDRAAPHHPVRLDHRSGHACVLNSIALERVGIRADTDEPPGGTIERDLNGGVPNGLLLEMDEWLEGRIPPLSESELSSAVAKTSKKFLSQGVTTVVDATASNSLDRWNLLRRLRSDGRLVPSLTVMPGAGHIGDFQGAGLIHGYSDSLSAVGHVKIMLTDSGGRLHPSYEAARAMVEGAHGCGFPVAIHAVEAEAVIAASEALAINRVSGLRDRIEHASECPPSALDALVKAKPVVVSQPSFIRESGARYVSEFGGDAERLYRFRSLEDSGILIAASSDAPVSAPDPLTAIHAAFSRRAASGEVVGGDEKLSTYSALKMHTVHAAYANYLEDEVGTITEGRRADFAVLSDDPTTVEVDGLLDMRVTMTIAGGEVVWQE